MSSDMSIPPQVSRDVPTEMGKKEEAKKKEISEPGSHTFKPIQGSSGDVTRSATKVSFFGKILYALKPGTFLKEVFHALPEVLGLRKISEKEVMELEGLLERNTSLLNQHVQDPAVEFGPGRIEFLRSLVEKAVAENKKPHSFTTKLPGLIAEANSAFAKLPKRELPSTPDKSVEAPSTSAAPVQVAASEAVAVQPKVESKEEEAKLAAQGTAAGKYQCSSERMPEDVKAVDRPKHRLDGYTAETPIEEQRKAHEAAKEYVRAALLGSGKATSVEFISPPKGKEVPLHDKVELPGRFFGKLDSDVFSFEYTSDVRKNVIDAGQSKGPVRYLFGAASQFNWTEAANVYTNPEGAAWDGNSRDFSQGARLQNAFLPSQVEAMNTAAGYGTNGLVYCLSTETKDANQHGYLMPRKEKMETVTQQVTDQGYLMEMPCIAAKPIGALPTDDQKVLEKYERPEKQGQKDVYFILTTAPAIGYGKTRGGPAPGSPEAKKLAYVCALQNYRAQFEQSIKLSEGGTIPVVFNAAGVGLGVFGNDPEMVAKAFCQAAREYGARLKQNHVQVRFQVFKREGQPPDESAQACVNHLKLTEFKPAK